jgi:hypothetical protein
MPIVVMVPGADVATVQPRHAKVELGGRAAAQEPRELD